MRTARLFCSGVVCLLTVLSTPGQAATEQEAVQLRQQQRFAAAASAFEELVRQNPQSVGLRLQLADALARDRQWQRALDEYQAVLRLAPNNAEALQGIGTVNRWRGHVAEARNAYGQARRAAPNDPTGTLGLAATEALDHDFHAAQSLYDEAARQWPQDAEAQQARYDFIRQRNPRVYLYYEDDLSFELRNGGVTVPLYAREELGAEYQKETRLYYLAGTEVYSRTDKKLLYTHFFGFNHTLELQARFSEYDYPATPTVFSAIDRFQEYRLRYAVPVVPEQVLAFRYTVRPTTLVNGQDFVAHKLEAELTSQWLPRLQTVLGTGWLHDLDSNATSRSDMTDETLLKLGLQYDFTHRLGLTARYITNPELDSSVDSATAVQLAYGFTERLTLLVREHLDDYRFGDDQVTTYLALRYTPTAHLWTEAGAKYVKRGPEDGSYPLVSVVWRF